MKSEAFVQLALDILSCSQKELAVRLNVSPTQISKWKKGDYMSPEMEEKLREITNIGDQDPAFVLWAGSLESAMKWKKLIHYLAEVAREDAKTGYNTYPLEDEIGILCWDTFDTLREMGVNLPKEFPKELDVDYEADDYEEVWDLIENNPYSDLISKIYNSLNDVYGFYAAYVSELIYDDELGLLDTPAENIEPCLMALAACKVDVSQDFASKIMEFRRRVMEEYEEWLSIVKDRAFRKGIPLRAELLSLVYNSNDALGHEADVESLGFNKGRLHPDIYMNELLIGMRMIHQVLPYIMEKLGIAEGFELDMSKLRIGKD